MEHHAFFHGPGSLFVGRRHRIIGFKAGHINGLCPETERSARTVDGHVAAAEDDDMLAHGCGSLFKPAQEVGIDLDAFEIIARKRQPGSHVGSDRHEDCIEALFEQSRCIFNLRTGLDRNVPGFEDVRDLLVEDFTRQTVGRNAVPELAAKFFRFIKYSDGMAELCAEISDSQAGRASADDGDLLARCRLVEGFLLPFAVIMLSRESLQVADGYRLIEVAVLALCLAVVHADVSKGMRERNLLTDGCIGRSVVALVDEADIAGHVDVRRTSLAAGNHIIFLADFGIGQLVADRSGRTYLSAGLAEAAVCVLQELLMESARIDFKVFPLLIMEHIDAAHVLADADAAAAEDAAVHVVQDQRVGVIGGEALCTHLEASGLRSDILDQHLQFAVAVLGAGGAVFRVPGEQQLESQHAEPLHLIGLRTDHQTVFSL